MIYQLIKNFRILWVTLAIVGCAGAPKVSDTRPDFYGKFVEEENLKTVDRIFPFRYRGWTPLDERYMIVNLTANRAFLLRFKISCLDATMEQQVAIRTINNMYVPARDPITFIGSRQGPCFADKIYPLTKEQSLEVRKRKEFRDKVKDS
ncbi:MAG: DUF6491 family protein [Kangiellaceae bacterium]|nr:DUF6491 family protein [Kangiellaceae bacterium]